MRGYFRRQSRLPITPSECIKYGHLLETGILFQSADAPAPRNRNDSQQENHNQKQKMRTDPQDQLKHASATIRPPYGIRRDGDGLAPIHGLQTRQETVDHAAFEVVYADEMGEVARDDQITGKLTPVERGGICAWIAGGDAYGDGLGIRAKRPDDRRSERARIAGVQHQDFLVAAHVDCA